VFVDRLDMAARGAPECSRKRKAGHANARAFEKIQLKEIGRSSSNFVPCDLFGPGVHAPSRGEEKRADRCDNAPFKFLRRKSEAPANSLSIGKAKEFATGANGAGRRSSPPRGPHECRYASKTATVMNPQNSRPA
jgi:hypothetical protein